MLVQNFLLHGYFKASFLLRPRRSIAKNLALRYSIYRVTAYAHKATTQRDFIRFGELHIEAPPIAQPIVAFRWETATEDVGLPSDHVVLQETTSRDDSSQTSMQSHALFSYVSSLSSDFFLFSGSSIYLSSLTLDPPE